MKWMDLLLIPFDIVKKIFYMQFFLSFFVIPYMMMMISLSYPWSMFVYAECYFKVFFQHITQFECVPFCCYLMVMSGNAWWWMIASWQFSPLGKFFISKKKKETLFLFFKNENRLSFDFILSVWRYLTV